MYDAPAIQGICFDITLMPVVSVLGAAVSVYVMHYSFGHVMPTLIWLGIATMPPALLPNLGGSIPNDVFTDVLAMPTIWVPHSYAGCSQHAPDEHALAPLLREGLEMMTGIFWDIGA